MDKMNNVNACMTSGFIPSCDELISFSGDEIENLVNGNFECNHIHNSNNLYNLRMKLFGNCDCNSSSNNLLLDGLGERYSYVNGTASIDNKCFDPDFKLGGVYTTICSNNNSRLFNLDLTDNKCGYDTYCSCYKGLKYGFSLSEIVKNIGDFNKLTKTCVGSSANICINQKSYFINKCGRSYIIFKFNLLNNGDALAQKILFSDVFPDNVFINKNCVFLNGCRLCDREIFLDKNRMVVKLPDLDAGHELNLMIVGVLCGSSVRQNNFSTISYVDKYLNCGDKKIIDISQKTSNIKTI